ncbi:hypothetical protein [Beijerinckia sp. L45]|uniref:hypothetical protein n=1 Tax=Beijerinckia sp. L45 TaxID=1641855 RepID=UPI001FEE8F12|nr:hypothetical protein [Beijerinckia sp. L45]
MLRLLLTQRDNESRLRNAPEGPGTLELRLSQARQRDALAPTIGLVHRETHETGAHEGLQRVAERRTVHDQRGGELLNRRMLQNRDLIEEDSLGSPKTADPYGVVEEQPDVPGRLSQRSIATFIEFLDFIHP